MHALKLVNRRCVPLCTKYQHGMKRALPVAVQNANEGEAPDYRTDINTDIHYVLLVSVLLICISHVNLRLS